MIIDRQICADLLKPSSFMATFSNFCELSLPECSFINFALNSLANSSSASISKWRPFFSDWPSSSGFSNSWPFFQTDYIRTLLEIYYSLCSKDTICFVEHISNQAKWLRYRLQLLMGSILNIAIYYQYSATISSFVGQNLNIINSSLRDRGSSSNNYSTPTGL